ncbi:MAG: flagellar basal body P-ring formation protein FlgA [Gammaproteobacteria bacterium]|nr:flagellar basal body P-ring formation protein FlgA [Gammaproteobacteria bacterium]
MKLNGIHYALAVLMLALTGTVTGGQLQDHASIKRAAESFITDVVRSSHGAEPTVRAGSLDSRLRLTRCDIPLEAFQPGGSRALGNTTVGIRCTGNTSWTLYVPVSVSLFGDVVVAARPLTRATLLTAADLKMARRDLAQLHSGYFGSIDQAIGKQAGRNIAVDTAISTSLVKEPLAVKRGQRVSLVALAGGLEVRMTGEAMSDGTKGQRIKVRNLRSKRVVDGIVKSATTIQVAMQ